MISKTWELITNLFQIFYSMNRVELALWTHFVATQLQPDLLDDIPAAAINSSTTVVETTTPAEGGDEIKTTTTTVNNVDDTESTADENSTDLPSAGESNGNGKNGTQDNNCSISHTALKTHV